MTFINRKNASKIFFSFLILSFAFVSISCESSTGPSYEPVEIKGKVVYDESDEPVKNALVRMIEPPPEESTATDEEGEYFFSLDVDSSMTVVLVIGKEGYEPDTLETTAIPQRDIDFPVTRLYKEGEEPVELPDDESEGPYSIVLKSVSSEAINVKETGDEEQALFVYEVTDSAGVSVRNAEVEFHLGSSPGGGETIYPETDNTDSNGEVSTTLTSGTKSGTVQVIAEIEREGFTVRSRPVRVAIQSGLPSQEHFTLRRPTIRNLSLDETSQIRVLLGDRYGNPVSAGTRVYFTTNHGVIGASATTDNEGHAQVTLQQGEPYPPDGLVTVTAQTADYNNQTIQKQQNLIFNALPILIDVTPSTFDIEHLSDQTFNYTVTDANGNPLPPGSTITVTVEGEDIEVIGDVDTVLDDHMEGGQGVTEFSFNVAGINEEEHLNKRPVFIDIEATTPDDSKTVQIQGRKAKEVMH